MAIVRVHVNQLVLGANRSKGQDTPAVTIKEGKANTYARQVTIAEPSTMVYRSDKPLSCGARVWVQTQSGAWTSSLEHPEADDPGRWIIGVGRKQIRANIHVDDLARQPILLCHAPDGSEPVACREVHFGPGAQVKHAERGQDLYGYRVWVSAESVEVIG